MTDAGHREPDPIAQTVCPQCGEPATECDAYELARTRKRWYCGGHGGLYFHGTASEAQRYAARKIADAAARGDIGGGS